MMKRWLLITYCHDVYVESYDTKSEACVAAMGYKNATCEVVDINSRTTFQDGVKEKTEKGIER